MHQHNSPKPEPASQPELQPRTENGVSVIMPVHNGGAYLKAAVDSILAQQGVLFELIIIDDHSTDNAISKLAKHQCLVIIQSQERGIVPALNTGIAKAKYPFVARMDGDDIAHPRRLVTQLELLLSDDNIDIVGTQVKLFSEKDKIADGYRRYQDWINQQCTVDQIHHHFFVESCIPHPTAMMHKRVLHSLGGYQDSPWPEDYDLWCRAFLQGRQFAKPRDSVLLQWRDYPQRTSRVDQRYKKQAFLQCKAHYLSLHLRALGHHKCSIWGTGPTGTKLHNYLLDENIEVSSFIDINPKLKGRKKHGKPIHVVSTTPTKNELAVIDSISLIAVSAWGAREKIEHALVNVGMKSPQDYILVA